MSVKALLRKPISWVGIFGAIVLIASLLWRATSSQAQARPIFYLPPEGEEMIYFAPWPGTATDLPISVADLELNGVTVVYEFDEMQALVEAGETVDAVIFHASRMAEVDPLWLQQRYRNATVIAAIDVTIGDLGRFVGDEHVAGDTSWEDGWQESPFFSILAFQLTGTIEEQVLARSEGRLLGSALRSTDNIQSAVDVDYFLSVIRRDVRALHEIELTDESSRP